MADYTQPDVVNKRVRFFDGQFLQDQDFIDEQKYHLDRERRQSRLLRVTGIAEGLMVTTSGAYQVTVAKGMAVDALGRQLVLATEMTLRLTDKFAKQQGIELHLIYQESPTDVAETGGRGARRWEETPKIAAVTPDGTVAVAPDGASSTWEGPTVLLARLAVADNGTVTVDGAAARKTGLSVPGNLGIGTTNPGSDLEIGNFDARNRYLTLKVQGGNQYRSGVKLWAWQENYGYSMEYDERGATGNGLHIRTHDRNADGTTRFFVGWNGNIGVGTAGPPWKLSVSSPKEHLALYREPTETAGGTNVFLELAQIDSAPARVPEVFPSIRFHHHYRFWHRIEAQGSGLHIKTGDPNSNDYSDLKARNIYAVGKLEVTGAGGLNIDLLVNGRLRSNNNDGGLWVTDNRFVGGHSTDKMGFWSNNAWRLTVQSNGNVGIGTTNPGSDLEIGNFEPRDRYLTLKVQGGNKYRSGVKLWAWQENYGYSMEYDERGATGNGLHIRAHDRNVDGTTRLFVGWNGNVGVGTTNPEYKLAISAPSGHLQLRREDTETVGGKQLFLELYQHDPDPKSLIPEVFPSIRFHHNNRFWHRIEAQGSGFHFKNGNLPSDDYTDINVQNIFVHGRLVYYWAPDGKWKHIENRADNYAGSFADPGPSDGRLKTAIRPIRNALDKISRLKGIDFRWNSAGIEYLTGNVEASLSAGPNATDEENQQLWAQERRNATEALSGEYLGLVAQDVEKVVPQVVRESPDGYKHISYAHLTALLIEAVKEQQEHIEKLRARIAALEPTPA